MTLDRENLRSGYTTGACAAAASRGALLALLHQRSINDVTIRLPGGQFVDFLLRSCEFTATEGRASVIKDAGDDPDVTHQAEICSRVMWVNDPGVTFKRGVGVGVVTKKGLPLPPGEPAINPAPRKLITDTIEETLAECGLPPLSAACGFALAAEKERLLTTTSEREAASGRGIAVEISVPRGEELAKKTFNPRLGIVGGISILGTTGIVVPYSTSAWLASVTQEIDVAAAQGLTELVLTVGARGERLARQRFGLPEEAFVQIGPFFGDALRHCAKAGIARVTVAAMIGKLAKFAAGHEAVHSASSAQDFTFLAEIARSVGASDGLAEEISKANTAQQVSEMITAASLPRFFDALCELARQHAMKLVPGTAVEVCLIGTDGSNT